MDQIRQMRPSQITIAQGQFNFLRKELLDTHGFSDGSSDSSATFKFSRPTRHDGAVLYTLSFEGQIKRLASLETCYFLGVNLSVHDAPVFLDRVFEGKLVNRFIDETALAMVPKLDLDLLMRRATQIRRIIELISEQMTDGHQLNIIARDALAVLRFADEVEARFARLVPADNLFYAEVQPHASSIPFALKTAAEQKLKQLVDLVRANANIDAVLDYLADKPPEPLKGEPAAVRVA